MFVIKMCKKIEQWAYSLLQQDIFHTEKFIKNITFVESKIHQENISVKTQGLLEQGELDTFEL